MLKRINITIDDELLNKIDSYSKKRFVNRSGLISYVLSSYLDYVDYTSSSSDFDIKHTTRCEEV